MRNEDYRIIREIGRGGMSVVYLAEHVKMHSYWALKQVSMNQWGEMDVLAEPEILKQLSHPMLPRIIDIFREDNTLYIAEEYIEGENLSEYLKRQGPIPEDQAVEWMRNLCGVLLYLHSQKPEPIIYRDMKPSNIMLCPDGNIRLIDFGIARTYKTGSDSDTTLAGTRGYAAPEQLSWEGQTDARADLYALGVTMYHLLTGRGPAESSSGFVPVRSFRPDLSAGIEYILWKCMRPDPEARYKDAAEILIDLNRIDQLKLEKKAEGKRKKRRMIAILAIAAVLLVFLGTGIFAVRKITAERKAYEEALAEKKKQEEEQARKKELEHRYILAVEALNDEDYDTAIQSLEEVLAEDQTNAKAYLALGDAWKGKASSVEDMEEAESLYDQAREVYRKAGELSGEHAESKLEELDKEIENRRNQTAYRAAASELYELFRTEQYEKVLDASDEPFDTLVKSLETGDRYYLYAPENMEKVLAIYQYGFIYYGEWEDGKRSGQGMWFACDKTQESRFTGTWKDDMPNGKGKVQNFVRSRPEGSGELYSVLREEEGNFTDGYCDGVFKIKWEMSDGSVREFTPVNITMGISDKMTYEEIYQWHVDHHYPPFQAEDIAKEELEEMEESESKLIAMCQDTFGRVYGLHESASKEDEKRNEVFFIHDVR